MKRKIIKTDYYISLYRDGELIHQRKTKAMRMETYWEWFKRKVKGLINQF